jgi:RNA recognition motif-containing protein
MGPNFDLGGGIVKMIISKSRKEQIKERREKPMNPMSTICVMNLAFEVKQEEIEDIFSKYGLIKKILMPLSPNGQPRGMVHIEFLNESDAQMAKD